MLQIFGGPEGCLDSIGNVDFFKCSIKMGFYRIGSDAKFIRDFIIGSTHGNQGKYLDLPFGQVPANDL